MRVISVRGNPEHAKVAIKYFQKKWASSESMMVYENCITNSLTAETVLPQWYLLYDGENIVGCARLITNDFISRMDLYPWLCALYIEEKYRGNSYGKMLIEKIELDAVKSGFSNLYLCTDHFGFYERYGFEYIGMGYHPWGESSRIYKINL